MAFGLYKETSNVKKYFAKGVEILHSDGGGQYSKITVNEATAPENLIHNPFSQRVNRTFLESI